MRQKSAKVRSVFIVYSTCSSKQTNEKIRMTETCTRPFSHALMCALPSCSLSCVQSFPFSMLSFLSFSLSRSLFLSLALSFPLSRSLLPPPSPPRTSKIRVSTWLATMGGLRLVGSLKLYVSFAEHSLFHRAVLQKTTIILRSLLHHSHPIPYTYAWKKTLM